MRHGWVETDMRSVFKRLTDWVVEVADGGRDGFLSLLSFALPLADKQKGEIGHGRA
jgi:hypothetical protein